MTRVLVTGATGQDGSYLIDQLAENSEAIHAFARHGSAGIDTLRKRWPDVAIHQGDLLEGDDLAKVIEQVQPDEIYNLAGVSSVARSWRTRSELRTCVEWAPRESSRLPGGRRSVRAQPFACCRRRARRSTAIHSRSRRTRPPRCALARRTARRKHSHTSSWLCIASEDFMP